MQEETTSQTTDTQQTPEIAGATVESIITTTETIERAQDLGFSTLPPIACAIATPILEEKDVLVHEAPKKGRALTYSLSLAELIARGEKNRTFIMTDHDGDAERISRALNDFGVSVARIGVKQRGGKGLIQSAPVVVGAPQAFLDAFDEGLVDGAKVTRAIIDGCEAAIQSGRMDELLNLLHEPEKTQIIFVRNDPAMGLLNFIKKFLKSPVELTIPESDFPIGEAARPARAPREQSPRAAREQTRERNTHEEAPQAEAPTAPAVVKKVPANAQHQYIELPAELLAKPNALGDLVEASLGRGAIVFCNSPSEADLSDVMLRKRGLITKKLVGFVSPQRIEAAVTALKQKEVAALIFTDISARDVVIEGIGLIVNYSLTSEVDVYLQRAGTAAESDAALQIVSLITPLDLANFHYLKKLIALEFSTVELPSKEVLAGAKIRALSARAVEKNLIADERIAQLLKQIDSDPNRDQILALLVSNTFDALPAAIAQADKGERHQERGDRDGGRERGGDYQGERDGRRSRNDRGDRRHGRGRDEDFNSGNAEGGDDGREFGRRGKRRNERSENEQPFTPPSRDIRLYVGQGSSAGLTEENLMAMTREKSELTPEQVKRVIVRKLYSFIDVAEEVADSTVAKMSEAEDPKGTKLLVKKAVMISAPREHTSRHRDNGSDDSSQNHESRADGDESSDAAQAAGEI
jgi:superfamily II DNA/RNA helicase